MSAIEVCDLVVRYGEVTAVDGVSFAAESGSVTALLGRNGAGKTSTVETLEGYRRPTSGSVRVLGFDPIGRRREVVGRIGVMLQSGGVYPSMTAWEAVSLFASYYPNPASSRELLDAVGLTGAVAHRAWRRLSGGEQQRLSLALALVGDPTVVFLDEPTAGVDPAGRQQIRSVVAALRDAGVCVLLTTHELDEAARMADRILILDRGRVVADGTLDSLRSGSPMIRFGAPPGLDTASLAAAMGGAAVIEESSGEYCIDVEPSPTAVAALTAWLAAHDLPLADLRAGRASLEDVFLHLTGGDE